MGRYQRKKNRKMNWRTLVRFLTLFLHWQVQPQWCSNLHEQMQRTGMIGVPPPSNDDSYWMM
ncbi:uncharacterized protein [Blastocystis hominis]|uniref:Uncharacterized protein n=1 Tax=Blastocystis hominis TaxID=12968 RepID=D8M0Y6_BLAHO|nr:uncharacterized protein [Blastocystis hominis]CBK21725.2 unnamed protein product [Blastocystis hominis]|eukprot:XP_012895773.1 uncharacterized protein [Blastocystis hominis]